jgi:hypothetical protein
MNPPSGAVVDRRSSGLTKSGERLRFGSGRITAHREMFVSRWPGVSY